MFHHPYLSLHLSLSASINARADDCECSPHRPQVNKLHIRAIRPPKPARGLDDRFASKVLTSKLVRHRRALRHAQLRKRRSVSMHANKAFQGLWACEGQEHVTRRAPRFCVPTNKAQHARRGPCKDKAVAVRCAVLPRGQLASLLSYLAHGTCWVQLAP